MEKTAKPINRFMFFFMIHSIVITNVFYIALIVTGKDFDLYTRHNFLYLLTVLPPAAFYFASRSVKIKDSFYVMPLGIVNIILIIIITLILMPAVFLLSLLSSLLFPNEVSQTVASYFTVPLWAVIITTSVIPAFFEETIFRGMIFDKNLNLPFWKKLLLSSFFFALIHLNPQQFLYTFVLGGFFVCIMYITRSIIAPMLSHFIVNSYNTWLVYVSLGETASGDSSVSQTVIYLIFLIILTFPLLVFAAYLLLLNNREKIAFEALVVRLRRLAELHSEAIEKTSAAMENITNPDGEGGQNREELKSPPAKRKFLTWEFWGVIAVYILFVWYYYFYI